MGTQTRYKLILQNTEWDVSPTNESIIISDEREGEFLFTRKKFPSIVFSGRDADNIISGSVAYEWFFVAEEYAEGQWTEFARGKFNKSDCEINEVERTVKVTPATVDRYTDFIENIDVEIDFLKYGIESESVFYTQHPIIQVYVVGSNVITNIVGGRQWQQDVSPVFSYDDLMDKYNFGDTEVMKAFIAGVGSGLSPDVTGVYTDTYFNNNRNTLQNGNYRVVSYGEVNDGDVDLMRGWYSFVLTSGTLDDTDFDSSWDFPSSLGGTTTLKYVGKFGSEYFFKSINQQSDILTGGTMTHNANANNTGPKGFVRIDIFERAFRWAIYDTSLNEYVFLAPMYMELNTHPTYQNGVEFHKITRNGSNGYTLDTDTKVKILENNVFARVLTSSETITQLPFPAVDCTQYPYPEEDIAPDNVNYAYAVPINLDADQIVISDAHQSTDAGYGRFSDDALFFAGEYFKEPTDPEDLIPLNIDEWTEQSLWFHHDAGTNSIQDSTVAVELRHAYRLSDVIDALLGQNTDGVVSHDNTSVHSDFFYGSSNAIRGSQRAVFLTPKSNVINAFYNRPATRTELTMKELVEMLMNVYNAYVDIDENNRLIVEFVEYFRNGRTYSGQNLGIDLTQIISTNSRGESIIEHSKSYSYDGDAPKRQKWEWMDETTDFFDGADMITLDTYVGEGIIKERNISQFSTDLDFLLANPAEANLDGLAILEATVVNGNYQVSEYTPPGGSAIQNGYLAVTYLQSAYFLYDAPAKLLSIQGVETAAQSVARRKREELEIVYVQGIDPKRLITTNVGSGIAVEFSHDRINDKVTLKIEHDTEL